jgi:membrane-associated phospholipid phosphatase
VLSVDAHRAGAETPTGETRLLVALQRRTATSATVPVARMLSHAGEHAGLWLAAGALGAAVDAPRRRQWVRATGAVLLAHGASVVLKRVARRVRPVHPALATHVGTPSRWSFPSSHATSTTTAAVVFAPLVGRWTLVLPPVMAWSRLALGVHYPTDVLSGAALGGVFGLLGTRTPRRAR